MLILVAHGVFIIPAGYCDSVVQDGDRSPDELASLASRAVKNGDYSSAQVYLSNAIDKNPNDIGKLYEPIAFVDKKMLDDDWGRSQLVRMLQDRPAMSQGVKENDALWRWACRRLGTRTHEGRFQWDPTQPKATTALFYQAEPSLNLRFQVSSKYIRGRRKGQDRSPEELWQSTVFELHNACRFSEFQRLDCLVRERAISKSEYVRARFGLEFLTVQETRAFYQKVYLPWASASGIQLSGRGWYLRNFWGTADENFAKFDDRKEYPWVPYGLYYDLVIGTHSPDTLQKLKSLGIPISEKFGEAQ